jgi:hypothetical protein
MDGEDFADFTLEGVTNLLHNYLRGSQKTVRFVRVSDGRRGVMRAFHKSSRDLLVTWDNGQKGKIDTYANVLPGDTTDEVIAEIKAANAKLDEARDEYNRVTHRDDMLDAQDLFTQTIGQDVIGFRAPSDAEADPDGVPVLVEQP